MSIAVDRKRLSSYDFNDNKRLMQQFQQRMKLARTVRFVAGLACLVQTACAAGPGYEDPTTSGGSLLTLLNPSSNLGEPLNVIISNSSDKQVLTASGILDYFDSLHFSPGSCAGISEGGPQQANLGDGNGYTDQVDVMRFNYYQGAIGSCIESVQGGNHFRYFVQNGSMADTGAIFIAASVEADASLQHMIVGNGYDLGRDQLVKNATNATGTTSSTGTKYTTTSRQVSLLQDVDQSKINHAISIDGQVAILTVRVAKAGSSSSSSIGGTSQSSNAGFETPSSTVASGAVRQAHISSQHAFIAVFLLTLATCILSVQYFY